MATTKEINMATSEAQKRANRKWADKNREICRRISSKSTTKRFVREMATPEEWKELIKIYRDAHNQ
ncbi:hypothetical protein [Leuconostoc lactis]|uniref:hypothetical protein n=1 Tax=Leuconostoc lactis TaxID=1246 RepID=UPI002FDFC050